MNNTIVQVNGNTVINGSIVGGDLVINQTRNGVQINGEHFEFSDKVLNITVEGFVEYVSTVSGNITANADCGSASTTSGDIRVQGEVKGNAKTVSGDIRAASILGKCSTVSGDIVGK